jgi:hypothetical protein
MGGKPNPGTPADGRLSDNQGDRDTSGTRVTADTGTSTRDTNAGTIGHYDTYMPWATQR